MRIPVCSMFYFIDVSIAITHFTIARDYLDYQNVLRVCYDLSIQHMHTCQVCSIGIPFWVEMRSLFLSLQLISVCVHGTVYLFLSMSVSFTYPDCSYVAPMHAFTTPSYCAKFWFMENPTSSMIPSMHRTSVLCTAIVVCAYASHWCIVLLYHMLPHL